MKKQRSLTGAFGLGLGFAAALGVAQPAMAGGLYLNEFATPSMGTAGAGSGAIANDASTSFHNPAGMTRLKGHQAMLGGGFLALDAKFNPSPITPIPGNDGGSAGGPGPILSAFGVYSVTDDFKLGFNVISISAALLDYSDNWTGRYLIDDVTMITVNINPTFAYRVNDWLSVGAGMSVMVGMLKQNVTVPPPTGTGNAHVDVNGNDFGFNAGVLLEPTDRTRIGIIYQSELKPDLGGDVSVTPPDIAVAIDTSVPFPQLVRVSLYHELNEQFALLGSLGWEDWSQLKSTVISTRLGAQAIPRNWRDTWHFSVGLHYKVTPEWTLQTGFTYDTSPVSAIDRTPDMPIDRQIRGAIGAQYQWSEDVTIGGAFVYADYGKAAITNPLLVGDYSDNQIYMFALNANWKF